MLFLRQLTLIVWMSIESWSRYAIIRSRKGERKRERDVTIVKHDSMAPWRTETKRVNRLMLMAQAECEHQRKCAFWMHKIHHRNSKQHDAFANAFMRSLHCSV